MRVRPMDVGRLHDAVAANGHASHGCSLCKHVSRQAVNGGGGPPVQREPDLLKWGVVALGALYLVERYDVLTYGESY